MGVYTTCVSSSTRRIFTGRPLAEATGRNLVQQRHRHNTRSTTRANRHTSCCEGSACPAMRASSNADPKATPCVGRSRTSHMRYSTTHPPHLLRPLPPVASSPPSPGSAHRAAAPVLLLAPPTLLPAAAAPTAAASAAAALPPRVVLPTRGLGGLPERARGSSPRGLCCTATGLPAPAAVAAAAATAAAGVSAGIASGASLPAAVGSSWVSSSSGPQLGQLMSSCTVPSGHTRTLVAWGGGGWGARVVSQV